MKDLSLRAAVAFILVSGSFDPTDKAKYLADISAEGEANDAEISTSADNTADATLISATSADAPLFTTPFPNDPAPSGGPLVIPPPEQENPVAEAPPQSQPEPSALSGDATVAGNGVLAAGSDPVATAAAAAVAVPTPPVAADGGAMVTTPVVLISEDSSVVDQEAVDLLNNSGSFEAALAALARARIAADVAAGTFVNTATGQNVVAPAAADVDITAANAPIVGAVAPEQDALSQS